ncbi:MAG: hypothetical protein V1866_05275 [archaeon]
MTKKILLAVMLLFALAISSPDVFGLGVSPGRVEMSFLPNYVYKGQACYTLSGIERLRFEVQGDINESIKIEGLDENNDISNLMAPEVHGCIDYTMTMPASFDKPGLHIQAINAVEAPDEVSGSIFAVVKIQHQIYIRVPYPGKYIEIVAFTAQNSNAGNLVPFNIVIIGKGIETAESAHGVISIYDKENNLIGTTTTKTLKNIGNEDRRELTAFWNSSPNREGNYRADLKLVYDDLTNNATTTFKLGGLDVNLLDYSDEVIIGGIKEFSMVVDSTWSETVKNVKATAAVFNYSLSKDQPITVVETISRDIPPWGTDTLKGFLDTSLLQLGNYTVKINITYENNLKEYEKPLSIIKEPPVPKAKKSNAGGGIFSTRTLLMGLGGALALLLIVLIIALIPKKKKQQPGTQ